MEEQKESTLLTWKAPEFVKYHRDWRWYTSAGFVYFGIVGYSVYARDWFMIVVATILLVLTYISINKEPQEFEYKLTQLGIYINGKLFPYNELHSFWTILTADQKVLNIAFRKKYLPALTILFYGIDPFELKSTLAKYIPEQEDRTESIVERLQRYLRLN